jgi:hypothetical protein
MACGHSDIREAELILQLLHGWKKGIIYAHLGRLSVSPLSGYEVEEEAGRRGVQSSHSLGQLPHTATHM